MSESTKGVLIVILTCVIWGSSLMYYKVLSHVPPLEVLSHRALWSFVFFAIVLGGQRRVGEMFALIRDHRWMVVVAAILVSSNWLGFIVAAQIGKGTESSIGYYIYPILTILLGRFALGEVLSPLKWLSVALAGAGVVVMTVGIGTAPYLALFLAVSFAIYGLIKKQIPAGPVLTVAAEVVIVVPLAIGWLIGVHWGGWTVFGDGETQAVFGTNWRDTLLLIGAGPMTSVPLLLFGYGAKRVSMSTMGVTFYINPTIQFFIAVWLFGEPFGIVQAIAFPMIWGAVALYCVAVIRQDRSARKRAASASASSTTS